jgi:hypothetical protein
MSYLKENPFKACCKHEYFGMIVNAPLNKNDC